MKMNELKLIYFSPTGTTHKVVMETARSIDLKSVSFDLTIKKDLKPVAKFAPNDFALFAIPVYYGRVPALFLKYLDLFSGNGTPAALVATYGCREYEDALLELKTEVEKKRIQSNRSCRISGRTLYRELYRRKTSEQGGFKRSFRIRNFTESDH
ncbi:MAG: flavodoxin family protein [[Ruminococcus] torques]